MAFVCPDKSERRQDILNQLKCLVNDMNNPCCPPPQCCPDPCCPPMCCPMFPPCCPPSNCCPPPACCQPCVQPCDEGPVIEIYDPLPKACVPVCSPPLCCPQPCCPQPCCPQPCCPQQCCPPPCSPMIPVCTGPMCAPPCCPPQCCPPSPCYPPQCCCPPPQCGPCGEVISCPVPICTPKCPIVLPPCMPITYPVNPPCVPVCNPCPEDQPCVPCNPPQMMVCYRRTPCDNDGYGLKRSKSRELRASVLYVGCDCIKRNGLQDDCPRSECQGSPACLTKPEPTCAPAEAARRMYMRKDYSGRNSSANGLEEYQCYPAYVKVPGMSCGSCGPSCGPCPGVPLIAQSPCPPTICPGPPPLIPIGTIMPVSAPCCPQQCCPCPC